MFHIYLTNSPDCVKPGSLGKPVDGYELKISADATDPCVLKSLSARQGSCGSRVIVSPRILAGSREIPDNLPWTLRRSGDLFRLMKRATTELAAGLITTQGIRTMQYPEIENSLMTHPQVIEAAVIGVKRDGLDSTRAVQAHDGGSDGLASVLQDHVRTHLARYKYPREVIFVDSLPRNDRGKVDKKGLPVTEATYPWNLHTSVLLRFARTLTKLTVRFCSGQ